MSKLLPVFPFACRAIAFLLATALPCCGPTHAPPSQLILSTQTARPEDSTEPTDGDRFAPSGEPAPADLKQQLIKDGQFAAKILTTAACADSNDRDIWATIYALRVGIAPDAPCRKAALIRGTAAASPLLRALSWRHILTEKDIPLPEWSGKEDEDPAVQILAALAYLVRSRTLPPDLSAALSLPLDTPPESDKRDETDKRAARTAAMTRPFDDGLLAGAVVLAETRYTMAAETAEGTTVWTAQRIRQSLLSALGIVAEQLPENQEDIPPRPNRPTTLGALMENQLATNPQEMLANIALNAPPPLRIQALRAVVIHSGPPSMPTLGAAAAALRADNPDVQIEGARTFLLLVRKLSR